jgi:biopolymer transport protein ExbB/TolQ
MPVFDSLRAAQSAHLLKAIAVLGALLLLALVAIGVLAWQLVAQRTAHVKALTKAQTEHTVQLRTCGEINDGATAVVETLTRSLTECRGESQQVAERLARAVAQREAEKRRIERAQRAEIESLNRLLETHDACRDRPVCRPLSDELRRRWAENQTD